MDATTRTQGHKDTKTEINSSVSFFLKDEIHLQSKIEGGRTFQAGTTLDAKE